MKYRILQKGKGDSNKFYTQRKNIKTLWCWGYFWNTYRWFSGGDFIIVFDNIDKAKNFLSEHVDEKFIGKYEIG